MLAIRFGYISRMKLNPKELQNILDFAVEAAQLAGAYTLGYFNAGTPHELKADRSPVTVADRGAEKLLRERIEAAYPTHGIVGEEFGEKTGSDPARWILDPIDGTVSFINGVPMYGVLVGFECAGEMLAGVMHFPPLNETVYAARGLGCRWNGRVARVSQVGELADARLLTTNYKQLKQYGRLAAFERLRDACALDRGWSDSYGYALIATGRADIIADSLMSIWDSAAVRPCIEEAGGSFTDWQGNPSHTAPEAIATNGKLLPQVLAKLRG